MNRLFSILLLFTACRLVAQEPPPEHATRERTMDVVHYKLVLSVDVRGKSIAGDAFITVAPLRPGLDTVRFDASGLKVSRVKIRDTFLSTLQRDDTLLIALDKPSALADTFTLDIGYSVTSPRKGMYFIEADPAYPQRQWQAWTQGEGTDNHYWFPCYDAPNDLATSETIVTVDDNLTVISNGLLVGKQHDAKRHLTTYHWKQSKPHVSYLVSLVIGTYVMVPDSLGVLPIQHYVYPRQANDALRSFGKTPAMIEYFDDITGVPFPWDKYGHTVIEDFMFGGEENVTISTLTDRTIHDARAGLDYSSAPLVAHELAHQWYGDLVSFRDWSHAWLSEGFATYLELLFREHSLGKDEADKARADAQLLVVNSDRFTSRRPTVCRRYNAVMDLFDNRIYQKGAAVLHMLRQYLGDELFFRSLRHYTRKFAFRNAETDDLRVAFEETTGYNLERFFDQWLFHAGYPEFDVRARWDQTSRMEIVSVRQIQTVDSLTPLFTVPVDIQVWVHNQPETYRVTVDRRDQTFQFPAYQEPQLVLFDKGSQLLKKVLYIKTVDELLFQLRHAEDAIDRAAAVDDLQWVVDSSAVRTALEQAAVEDRVGYVRRAATWALGDVKHSDETDILATVYGDRESGVRTAAVTALGKYRGEKVVALLQHAFRVDSSYVVAAAAMRSLTLADSLRGKEYLAEAMGRESYNEGIRSAALQRYAELADTTALRVLTAWTKNGVDRNLRIQSIRSLLHGWRDRDDIIQYVCRYLTDPSYYVRRSTIDALGELGSELVLKELDKVVSSEHDDRIIAAARDARAKVEAAIKAQHDH